MNALESKLCWDIINCPNSCPGQCNAIVSLQASNEYWQIPEPWNGFLTSGFLVIAGNPALDDAELYPATSSSSSLSWVGPGVWDKDIVESYFEGRFGKSTNPAFLMKKYVDVLTTKDLYFITGILFMEKTAELPACKYPASRPTSLFEKAETLQFRPNR